MKTGLDRKECNMFILTPVVEVFTDWMMANKKREERSKQGDRIQSLDAWLVSWLVAELSFIGLPHRIHVIQ